MECSVLFILVLSISVMVTEAVDINVSYVGCYDPFYSTRQRYNHHIPSVSLEKCTRACVARNTQYAGISLGSNFCFCGDDIADESVKRPDFLCDQPCAAGSQKTCGGDYLMSLYSIPWKDSTPGQSDVSFLVGISTGVRMYNISSLTKFDNLMVTGSDWAHAVDYHYAKNLLFVSTRTKLYKTTLMPKTSTSALVPDSIKTMSTTCDALAVDWLHDRIIWVDCDTDNTFKTMDLDGANESILLRRPAEKAGIKRMEVDPFSEMIFWTADGVIESCELSGGNFQTNLSSEGVVVRSIALNLNERRVYYVGTVNQTASLFSMDYEGGSHLEHQSGGYLRSLYGLGIHKGFAYWVNYANVQDVLYRAPLNLGSTEVAHKLTVIDRSVWHMKVMHRDLQPTADPCGAKACSYECQRISPTKALCHCPEGLQLNGDGVTCTSTPRAAAHKAPVSVVTVSLNVLLIVGVVLVAVILLYLADNYWSFLHTKLFGVPYVRKVDTGRDVSDSPVYNTSQDNVNLV